MAVRKHPTKPGWWQIVISHGRNNPQSVHTFQGTWAEAKAFEADIRGIPADVADSKVLDLTARFFDWYVIHRAEKSNQGCQYAFQRLLPILGDRYISLLHQNDYDGYKAARLEDGVTKRTINIELTYFRAFLRWCREEKGLTPGADPKLFPKKDTRPKATVVPSRSEIAALLNQLSGDKLALARLMAWCGLRRGEALSITRGNVDLANRTLIITGKGNKTRTMPIIGDELYQQLWAACKGRKRHEYLFPNKPKGRNKGEKTIEQQEKRKEEPYKNIRKAIKTAAVKAGIDKRMYNHLLRHAFGTEAVTADVNLRALQTMLGHSDIRTTEIYTHLAADHIKAEAAKLSAHLNPLMPQKKPKKQKGSDMSDSKTTRKKSSSK